MTEDKKGILLPDIRNRIFFIRGKKVMLSMDLAELYEVAPKVLMQSVKRNEERFPPDFMFQFTLQEFNDLKSQIVTSSRGGIRRAMPYAFTEQGVAMLSGVLNSSRAIRVNIEIMRTFVQIRRMLAEDKELARRLDELEKKYDKQFRVVFNAIRALTDVPVTPRRKIGFERKD